MNKSALPVINIPYVLCRTVGSINTFKVNCGGIPQLLWPAKRPRWRFTAGQFKFLHARPKPFKTRAFRL